MVNYNGGLTKVSQTLQTLYLALDNFKKFGPPSIPVFPLSRKEMQYRQCYFQEEFDICDMVDIFDDLEIDEDDELHLSGQCTSEFRHKPLNIQTEVLADEFRHKPLDVQTQALRGEFRHKPLDIQTQALEYEFRRKALGMNDNLPPATDDRVHTCCNSLSEDESKLRDLKYWYRQMEGGTTVDYRCPACRECTKCKDSDKTDKISLREEVEQKAVEDSVFFDRENKKVMVKLPKRGEEEFFLSSNRECAMKVYKNICQKASKSEDIKQEINAAFAKLFKNGHAMVIKDVDKNRLAQFINKPVQHYLPWRLVWKADSLTTPCRPVFDASTNTKKRLDGSGGGRSLNDLLCKGRVDTLDLLKMIIRFTIGSFALT